MLYKTLLVNLKKDFTRLDFMTRQLNNLNIPFDRLEAIHGRDYMETCGDEYDEIYTIKKTGKKMTLGEIGCALSHKRCYFKFLNDPKYKDTKYLLILEDDVELDKDFKNILEGEIQKNEEKYKWNYLQFNYPQPRFSLKEKYKYRFVLWKSLVGAKQKILKLPHLIFAPIVSSILHLRYYILSKKTGSFPFFIKIHVLAGAYLLDKKTASILLKLTENIIKPSDIIISEDLYKFKNKDMNFYFYTPLIARQMTDGFQSSIDQIEKRS